MMLLDISESSLSTVFYHFEGCDGYGDEDTRRDAIEEARRMAASTRAQLSWIFAFYDDFPFLFVLFVHPTATLGMKLRLCDKFDDTQECDLEDGMARKVIMVK